MNDRTSRIISLALTLGLTVFSQSIARAQSIIPTVDKTNTLINQSGNIYTIQEGIESGQNLFHSFQEFGLSTGEIANFLSRAEIQNIFARVVGGNASLIDGLLQVSGGNSNLYLMNPAGIVFGSNAQLNVPGDFFATTATGIGFGNSTFNAIGENDYANLTGMPLTFEFDVSNPGTIINAGELTVETGNNIGLVGGSIINTGTLNAEGGNILITAVPGTNRVKLSQPGNLLSVEIEMPVTEEGTPQAITPLDLPELLTGAETQGIATGLEQTNGEVRFASGEIISQESGIAAISGELNVQGGNNGEQGILVLGERVGLFDAHLDASGVDGGGSIYIGGNYQGQGNLPTADYTFVDENTTLGADAIASGDGGRVIVWSDNTTNFFGNISAMGGEQGGNGGFVEVSGKIDLNFAGFADTSAPLGETGTLMLDPTNITIVAGSTSLPSGLSAANDASIWGGGFSAEMENSGSRSIGVENIKSLLMSNDLILEASNRIT